MRYLIALAKAKELFGQRGYAVGADPDPTDQSENAAYNHCEVGVRESDPLGNPLRSTMYGSGINFEAAFRAALDRPDVRGIVDAVKKGREEAEGATA
jgi:hypothetical protein